MQSLLLFAAALVVLVPGYFIAIALAFMNSTIASLLSMLVWLVVALVGIALFVFMVIAAIKAFQGQVYKIPFIGNFADQWS
jgi:uncharacterized membrane protein